MNSPILVEKLISSSNSKLKRSFIDNIFKYIPSDYQSKISFEELEMISEYSFEKFLKFDGRRIISHKIYNEKKECTIFSIHGKNMPFLVDTVKNLIEKLNLSYKYIFHPIIETKRNTAGSLEEICKYEGYNDESFILVYFDCALSLEEAKMLTINLEDSMDKVEFTNNAWQKILLKIDETINTLTKKSLISNNSDIVAARDFLEWLKHDNFTFIATAEIDTKKNKCINLIGNSKIWDNNSILNKLTHNNNSDEINIIEFGKIDVESTIYKNYYYDFIKINYFDDGNNIIGGRIIIGVFSYSMDFQSISQIPIIKQKFDFVKIQTSFHEKGYNSKKTRIILESIPRVALLHMPSSQLSYLVNEVLSSMLVGNIKLFNIGNCIQNFMEMLIFLPRTKFSPSNHLKIQKYIQTHFNVSNTKDYISELGQEFIFIYITFSSDQCFHIDASVINKIQTDLASIITDWNEDAIDEIKKRNFSLKVEKQYINFLSIFPDDYKFKSTSKIAIDDLINIFSLDEKNKIIYELENLEGDIYLKIFSAIGKLTISETTPILENLGFSVIEEHSYKISHDNDYHIHIFSLKEKHKITDFEQIKKSVEEKLYAIYFEKTISDELSKLITFTSLPWREIDLIRTIVTYMHQTNFLYDYKYVSNTLLKHFEFTQKLINLFHATFDPKKTNKKLKESYQAKIVEYISQVENNTEDKVLRTINKIFLSIIRTNFYQKDNDNNFKKYISIKLDSSKIPDIPKPIPFAEIFVYSKDFEGIHLRGGKVARGGLRWSDRGEDYRTEVLGLMKAQMTKNTVIVPEGSKGGFFTKFNTDGLTRDDHLNKAIECYKNFLRGLLDLTDNIIGSSIISPRDTICLDENDPYLVVAADKGTATFSDYANEISQEYNFWLGDAFASGGSAGYDHKKMGITAKGAWISVKRHFKEIGIDVEKDPISVVGIGDMSGDVFGNGLLLSKTIKLIAAFNHMHIFIDPTPDPKESYKERKRLFDKPRSSWSDYNLDLISKGGGVFDRKQKTILLSQEMKDMLNISDDSLSPDQLINNILKAKVDLIWNGGIGTYIKSKSEHNQYIGDKSNDSIRVNGEELNAKAFGEGGNLGASQLGRVEFALNGGMINTDFIDNSAGVDCSDHEVNIKITLGKAVESNKLTLEERNILLHKMTDQISDLVLMDNSYQTLSISFMEQSQAFTMESFIKLLDVLDEEKLLKREIEFIPNNKELMQRAHNGKKLTKPELSVLISYSKMLVYKSLQNSMITTDEYFETWLLEYFPNDMRENFKNEILSHPLRKEIILTIITNRMVNQISGPVINSLLQDTGAHLCNIARGFVIIEDIFEIDSIWNEVDNLDKNIPNSKKIEIYTDLNKVIRRGITWMINNFDHPLNIKNSIKQYKEITLKVSDMLATSLIGSDKEKYENKFTSYKNAGIPIKLSHKSAKLETLVSSFDIAHICDSTGADIENVCKTYFQIASSFSINWLRRACDKLMNDSYWDRVSLQSMKDDLYDKQRRILRKIVAEDMHHKPNIWIDKNSQNASIFNNFMKNIMNNENIDINMLIIANKKLEMFIRKS